MGNKDTLIDQRDEHGKANAYSSRAFDGMMSFFLSWKMWKPVPSTGQSQEQQVNSHLLSGTGSGTLYFSVGPP